MRLRLHYSRLVALAALLIVVSCTGIPEGVVPIRPFDIARYQGKWHEIMRLDHSFERGLTNVDATYSLREDGSIGVLNRGFDRKACEWNAAEGRAVFQEDPSTASLSVTFFWPFAGGYHVIDLDRESYGWALVSGPSKDYLWILARKPSLPLQTRKRLVEKARSLGFPVDELILVDHGPMMCERRK
ncbi:MAG: lipocalin family protein [Bdellovibrionales bacterium]